ncbi:uncharacterized protein [Malus domestica]|uniref:uncharacterized protein n=1 Tax=Malus domestica TaxID=3750 RepID=UPI00397638D0
MSLYFSWLCSFPGVYSRESFSGCGGVFHDHWVSRRPQYSFAEFDCLSSPCLRAPPLGVIKANFDGAWSRNSLQSGLGVVFRSSNGSIFNGVSSPCLSSSALQTEAKAALLAVRSALDSNFSDVVFESDSKELIGSLNNDFKKANWTIFPLLIQIRNLSTQFCSIYWRWVPRQANSAADWVASHCKRGMCSDVWVIRPPSSLVHILSKDGLPCPP